MAFGTGGRTKFDRTRQGHPKDRWIDAACVGESGVYSTQIGWLFHGKVDGRSEATRGAETIYSGVDASVNVG